MYSPVQNPRSSSTKNDILRFREISKYCSGSVLDVGCGDQGLKTFLSSDCIYTGVDIDMSGDSFGDVYNLSFSDNSFSVVVLSEVLEHLVYPLKALIELKRITSRDLIVSIPNPYSSSQIFSVMQRDTNCIDPDHISLFGDNEIRNLCKLAGFSKVTPIRFYTYIPVINWMSPIKSSFGEWSIYKIVK